MNNMQFSGLECFIKEQKWSFPILKAIAIFCKKHNNYDIAKYLEPTTN